MLVGVSRLPITQKLYAILTIIMVSMAAIGLFAFYKINELTRLNNQILQKPYVIGIVVRDIENAIISLQHDLNLILHEEDKVNLFNTIAMMSETDKKAMGHFKLIRERLPKHYEVIGEIEELFFAWRLSRQSVIEAVEKGDNDKATLLAQSTHRVYLERIGRLIAKIKDIEVNNAFELSRQSDSSRAAIILNVTIAFLALLTLSSALIFLIARSFVNPTRELARTMRTIADGGSDVIVPHTERKDEIGAIARATEIFQEYSDNILYLNNKLEASDKVKSEFLANMSHEIRTPMNGIIGTTSLMENTNLSDQQKQYVSLIRKSSNYLLQLINDILDLSKIEAGKLDFEILPFNLYNLVEEVEKNTSVNLSEDVTFILDWHKDTPRFVEGDPGRIRQILFNLVGNAVKFTREGHIKVKISPTEEKDDKRGFLIAIEDTGIGISREKQNHIFEKFSQADASTTRNFGGTGLGLAVCSELVRMMGGQIEVESTLGKGSTFSFTMYLNLSTERAYQQNIYHKHTSDIEDIQFDQVQVLLAEDDRTNMMIATELLESIGCLVTPAGNGVEAVERASKQEFDVILMDCRMPEMDGYEATKTIKEQEQKRQTASTPIIAFTANAMKGDREKCITAGMNDYISKPIKKEELASVMLKWLPRYKLKAAE